MAEVWNPVCSQMAVLVWDHVLICICCLCVGVSWKKAQQGVLVKIASKVYGRSLQNWIYSTPIKCVKLVLCPRILIECRVQLQQHL